MKGMLLFVALSFSLSAFAQETSQTARASSASTAVTAAQTKGCLAVKDAGSHAFRNIMLAGVAGAIISKKQYQVVDVVEYPARIGQKFHGNDLQTLQTSGVKIVILNKKYAREDLQRACR